MSKQAKVSKIIIEIGDKVIEFTPEQAKELEKILHEMFGDKLVVHEHYPYWPHYWTTTIRYDNTFSDNVAGNFSNTAGNVSDTYTIHCKAN